MNARQDIVERSALAGSVFLSVGFLSVGLLSVGLCMVLAVVGCAPKEDAGPQVGSNSNWLRACGSVDDCEEVPECACGVCTAGCSTDDDCAPLADARCVLDGSPAARSVCESESARGTQSIGSGLCLPRCDPGECGEGQACSSGACVLAAFPDNAFCAAASGAEDIERTREDELLALVQMARAATSQECPGAPATTSGPQPPFRFDARLGCAARVLAHELAATRELSLTDSEGRDTQQRLSLADYDAQRWNEAFALEAETAQHALETILQQAASCPTILGAAPLDVGVANVADVYVITLAQQ